MMMKTKFLQSLTILALAVAVPAFLSSCNEDDHSDHDHGEHDHHEGDDEEHAGHDDDHGHEHAEGEVRPAGPNGGRIITDVEPHVEFLVTDERKVKITSLDNDNKPTGIVPAFEVVVTGGDRSNPTRLQLAKVDDALVSDGTLPDGKMFPVVIQFKTGEGKPTMTKFNVDLNKCPTCEYLEYACICAHAEGHDHDHDHKHE